MKGYTVALGWLGVGVFLAIVIIISNLGGCAFGGNV